MSFSSLLIHVLLSGLTFEMGKVQNTILLNITRLIFESFLRTHILLKQW